MQMNECYYVSSHSLSILHSYTHLECYVVRSVSRMSQCQKSARRRSVIGQREVNGFRAHIDSNRTNFFLIGTTRA
jgi:hypothetical protein